MRSCLDGDVAAAIALAQQADVVIVVIVGTSGRRGRLPVDLGAWPVGRSDRRQWVSIDSRDIASLALGRRRLREFDVAFKRELYVAESSATRRPGLLAGRPWSHSPVHRVVADSLFRHPPFGNHRLGRPALLARPPATTLTSARARRSTGSRSASRIVASSRTTPSPDSASRAP